MNSFLKANAAWFTFEAKSGNFGVYEFSGQEEVNEPYEFSIELVSRSACEDITGLLGTEALLSIMDRSHGTRHVHGLIRHMEQLHTANAFTFYRCRLVPRLWFLSQRTNHKIFQHLSVPKIIEEILREQGFGEGDFAFKLSQDYEEREYCVQYRETDLHFISRLCEEEGIYFYFEHDESSHCLCFCDHFGGPKIPGESLLRFFPGSGTQPDTSVISRLNLNGQVNSNSSTYREWNFTKPKLELQVGEFEPDPEKAPQPENISLETYQFPHLYQLRTPGDRSADLQLMRQLTFREWIELESDVSRFLPSYTFIVHSHPRPEVNACWWVTSARHEGEQPGVLEHEAPPDRGLKYASFVNAIPELTRFIPAIKHPKNRVEGLQSAIVTGPAGEEAYCDEYGRVRVQFHWDRLGLHDENSTCWVRVADTWAGDNFGFIQIPRIGQEVIVEYMEGDPDRPVITGRGYNTLHMPPWQLPEQKKLSGIQSREFKGIQRNQLVMDDTEGEVQAQISSDHQLSQLNLGYLTRVRHRTGRGDFRGEGFELRTDGWGVVRAGKGLVVTTQERDKAREHQKDITESRSMLENAENLHGEATTLSAQHNAADDNDDVKPLKKALEEQNSEIKGDGQPHGELAAPHLMLHSPAGIEAATPHSVHVHTGEHSMVTSVGHTSVVAGKSIIGTALDAVRLFAHKMGIRIFAGKGKVEIQAQSDELDVIAQKVLRIISTQESIQLTAAREILLNADGSYIRINGSGIFSGTQGRFVAHASNHSFVGPDSQSPILPDLPMGEIGFNDEYIVRNNMTGLPIDRMKYEIAYPNGGKVTGITGKDGKIPMQESISPDLLTITLLGKQE